MKLGAFARAAFFSDDLSNAFQFLRHLLIGGNDFIESIRNLAREARPGTGQTDREVAVSHGLQAAENDGEVDTTLLLHRDCRGTPIILTVLFSRETDRTCLSISSHSVL